MNEEELKAETGPETFPDTLFCPRCRRSFVIEVCQSKSNTLLTDIHLSCPRCRRKLHKMRFKDWYDHYIHERQKPPPVGPY